MADRNVAPTCRRPLGAKAGIVSKLTARKAKDEPRVVHIRRRNRDSRHIADNRLVCTAETTDVLDVVTDGVPSAIHAHFTGILAGESNDELFNEDTIFPITGDGVTRLAKEFFRSAAYESTDSSIRNVLAVKSS